MLIPSAEIKGIQFKPGKESDDSEKNDRPSEATVTLVFCCDDAQSMGALKELLDFASRGPTAIRLDAQRELTRV